MSRLTPYITYLAVFWGGILPVDAGEPSLLPARGETPVIELWYLDGSPGAQAEVIILADGRVQVLSADGPRRSQLPRHQVESLLRRLVLEDGLGELQTADIQRDLVQVSNQTGLSHEIQGAAETVLRIRTASDYREIRCPAVGILSVRFPGVRSITAVARAQRRLENVRAVTALGGIDVADALAIQAAQAVANEYGVQVDVTAEDLSMVRSMPDGSRYCQFLVSRNENDPTLVQMISIVQSPGNNPRVSMVGGSVVR